MCAPVSEGRHKVCLLMGAPILLSLNFRQIHSIFRPGVDGGAPPEFFRLLTSICLNAAIERLGISRAADISF
jgi:hypothetical protein